MAESGFILLAMNRKQAFGQLIAEGRGRAGLYGKDLAPRLGISPSTLSNLETGNFSYPPDPELLDVIEREIGVTKNELGAALGYHEDSSDSRTWDTTLPPVIRQLLADIDWSPVNTVRTKTMLETIRDTQRSQPQTPTSELENRGTEEVMRLVPAREEERE